MQEWQETPLSFSEILDITFRIVKENFIKFFLIMLIFTGPIYLIQGIGELTSGLAALGNPIGGQGIESLLGGVTQQGANLNIGLPQVVLFFISTLLLLIVAQPMSRASLIIATGKIKNEEEINISATIKQAFARFFPLLGGSIVYGLVIYGLILAAALIIVIYLAISGVLGGLSGLAPGLAVSPPANLGSHMAVIIILSLISLCGIIYLITRWSFFFAAIVFEKVSPGLGKSWRLTRGCFWRLVGLYLVVAILYLIIIIVFQAVATLLGSSALAFILSSLVSMIVGIVPVIAYAVIYFDLRVRNEALDLKGMIETYQGNADSNPEASGGQYPINIQKDDQPGETDNR